MDDGDSSDNPSGFLPHKLKKQGMTCVMKMAARYAFFVLFAPHSLCGRPFLHARLRC